MKFMIFIILLFYSVLYADDNSLNLKVCDNGDKIYSQNGKKILLIHKFKDEDGVMQCIYYNDEVVVTVVVDSKKEFMICVNTSLHTINKPLVFIYENRIQIEKGDYTKNYKLDKNKYLTPYSELEENTIKEKETILIRNLAP